jgi:hypothetical protein
MYCSLFKSTSKFCPSLFVTVGFRVPSRYDKDISLFSVCSSSKNSLSTRCSSADNILCRNDNVFGTETVSINHIS